MSQLEGRYLVIDRDRLAGLIQRVVKERFGGSQRRAARELAGPGALQRQVALQRQISRLVRGEAGRIAKETVQSLADLVGRERHEELRRTLLTPAARLRLNLHRLWIKRELAHTPRTPDLEDRLRREYPDLFRDFDRFLERTGYIERIERPSGLSGVIQHAPRADLAIRDVLAPLSRNSVAGQIERCAAELSPTEMRRYLKHAFAAQRVLLQRPSDVVRAQTADSEQSADSEQERKIPYQSPHAGRSQIVDRTEESGWAWGWEGGPWVETGFATEEDAMDAAQKARYPSSSTAPREAPSPGSSPDPPRRFIMGPRVTGVCGLPEMKRQLREAPDCDKCGLLDQFVTVELEQPEPRKEALLLFRKAAKPLEAAKPPEERCLTNKLTAALRNLDDAAAKPPP